MTKPYDSEEQIERIQKSLELAFRRISDLENKSKNGITYGPITQIGRCLVCGEYHSSQFMQCPRTIVTGATP